MKLEEFKLIFQEIARGKHKLYNKLKAPEIMEVCRKWESRRSELLERLHVHNPDIAAWNQAKSSSGIL